MLLTAIPNAEAALFCNQKKHIIISVLSVRADFFVIIGAMLLSLGNFTVETGYLC